MSGRNSKYSEQIYGIVGESINLIAEKLSETLSIKLYLQESPAIGRWYSSEDFQNISRAIEEGINYFPPNLQLELFCNDTEPGFKPPHFAKEWKYIVRVKTLSREPVDLERAIKPQALTIKLLQTS